MFDRELFVDSTRSVSVVLGEKDNKSVSKYLEICYSGKSFADGKDLMSCAFFGTSFEKSASSLRDFSCSFQVLKKRTKEVRQEEQRNKKKNRHKVLD